MAESKTETKKPARKPGNEEKSAAKKENAIFSWTAREYIQHERGPQWYIIAGIILAAFIVYSVFTANWTLALAAIVFAAVYEYIQRHHPPKKVEVAITDLGIHVGHMFFPYANIKAFWILYQNGVKTLNLRVHRRYLSDVVIQLEDQDPAAIREYLVGQISELEGKHESLQDVLTRILRL